MTTPDEAATETAELPATNLSHMTADRDRLANKLAAAEAELVRVQAKADALQTHLDTWRANAAKVNEHMVAMTKDRDCLQGAISYLAAVAENNPDHYVHLNRGSEDEDATVLVIDPVRPDLYHRVQYTNTGQVALVADLIQRLHEQLRNDQVVDAHILPAWADMDVDASMLVGTSGEKGITIDQLGPYTPAEALVIAAWLYTLAEVHLEDIEIGWRDLLDRVRGS